MFSAQSSSGWLLIGQVPPTHNTITLSEPACKTRVALNSLVDPGSVLAQDAVAELEGGDERRGEKSGQGGSLQVDLDTIPFTKAIHCSSLQLPHATPNQFKRKNMKKRNNIKEVQCSSLQLPHAIAL